MKYNPFKLKETRKTQKAKDMSADTDDDNAVRNRKQKEREAKKLQGQKKGKKKFWDERHQMQLENQ